MRPKLIRRGLTSYVPMQCLARIVHDKKKDEGTGVFWFTNIRHRFFVPFRCSQPAGSGGICISCAEREKKTGPYVEKMSAKGSHIPNQGTLFHGLLTECAPTWSHVYRSSWYEKEIANGALLDTEDSRIIEESWESTYKGIELPESMEKKSRAKKPVAAPIAEAPAAVEAPAKKFRAKKTVAAAPVVEAVAPVPVPVKKRAPPKKTVPAGPIGLVVSELKEDVRVVDITVKKTTINDRTVYLGPKDKVYDLKFKYIGRYNRSDDTIVSHPDSDADV